MIRKFGNPPGEDECERASYSYLMSLVAVIMGLPLPIVNLIATLIFWANNRRATYFVRWHCTQALLSQLLTFFLNSAAFWWTVSILTSRETVSNSYFAYLILVIGVNLVEFVATLHAAIQTRKGIHVDWFIIGEITDLFVQPDENRA